MAQVTQSQKSQVAIVGESKTYKEVVSFLDSVKSIEYSREAVERTKKLDKLLGNVSQSLDIILVGGTNGKSSTIHFTNRLLKEEQYKTGLVYSTHVLTYNERIAVDSQIIQNKAITDFANEVINVSKTHNIDATSFEIMLFTALLYFKSENVNVALIEVGLGGKLDATAALSPKIAAVTRVAQDNSKVLGEDLDTVTFDMLEIAKRGCWLVSAEQSKIRLNKMKKWADDNGVQWSMPVRKLASLPYMYEQLYGRSASLGERIAQIYVEDVCKKFSPFLRGNLLATKKGQRGRPTLEAKRSAELNPIKTLKKFWYDEFTLLPGRFEFLSKERPSILLDNADNLDAFVNTFLGIRLLHYQHPVKELAIIVGLPERIDAMETVKLIRYLLKKVAGQAIFVPLSSEKAHDTQSLEKFAQELGINAKRTASFESAFEEAKKAIDEQDGLIVVIGHQELVTKYWQQRGTKKI